MSKKEKWDESKLVPTRIAVYDDFLSAPRIVDVEPCEIRQYIEQISSSAYMLAKEAGGSIPYTIIQEVCENFIHAYFKEPCISILDEGNTIRFTDQGPGIQDKERAQLPGFTSADSEMRKYIRGVGSGLPTVREYLKFSNGRLIIEDNICEGTVVTISTKGGSSLVSPVVYKEHTTSNQSYPHIKTTTLEERDYKVLELAKSKGQIGPTVINKDIGLSLSTAYRVLAKLEEDGLLTTTSKRKKELTDKGQQILSERVYR